MIYLDNAATTMIKPQSVIEAVMKAINFGNAGRGSSALSSTRNIFMARENIANFFGIKNSSNLAFTSNSTESLNIAIKGLFNEKDHIITTVLEHNSVLRPVYEIEKKGIEVSIIGADEKGNLLYDEILNNIKENTKAIICTHASNLTGNLIEIGKISKICKKYNLLFILDASQTAGVYDIDVARDGIDILCFTGHKSLFGVQGIGGIYVRDGIEIRPLKSGGTGIKTYSKVQPKIMPTLLEAGTLNSLGIMGLSAGIDFIKDIGIDKIRNHEIFLMEKLYKGIKDIENIKIYGDFTKDRSPVISFNIGDYGSNDVAEILSENFEIASRAGGHCAPLMHKHFGTENQGMVRLSIGYFNTEQEIEIAIDAIKTIAKM